MKSYLQRYRGRVNLHYAKWKELQDRRKRYGGMKQLVGLWGYWLRSPEKRKTRKLERSMRMNHE